MGTSTRHGRKSKRQTRRESPSCLRTSACGTLRYYAKPFVATTVEIPIATSYNSSRASSRASFCTNSYTSSRASSRASSRDSSRANSYASLRAVSCLYSTIITRSFPPPSGRKMASSELYSHDERDCWKGRIHRERGTRRPCFKQQEPP